MNDTGNPVHGHVDLTRKFRSADAKLAQLFCKMFAGMDGPSGHDGLPSMVIDDLYVNRAK
jgi:hypothetical protein